MEKNKSSQSNKFSQQYLDKNIFNNSKNITSKEQSNAFKRKDIFEIA